MKEKLDHMTNCVAFLRVICFFLLILFLASLFTQGAAYGLVLCGLICFGVSMSLSAFIKDMREVLDEEERRYQEITKRLYMIQHHLENQ